MNDYLAKIPYTIKGIPCLIAVVDYFYKRPDTSTWDSDWDYYGYEDIDYIILDRKGYPANWLASKVDYQENLNINEHISTHFRLLNLEQ